MPGAAPPWSSRSSTSRASMAAGTTPRTGWHARSWSAAVASMTSLGTSLQPARSRVAAFASSHSRVASSPDVGTSARGDDRRVRRLGRGNVHCAHQAQRPHDAVPESLLDSLRSVGAVLGEGAHQRGRLPVEVDHLLVAAEPVAVSRFAHPRASPDLRLSVGATHRQEPRPRRPHRARPSRDGDRCTNRTRQM